MNNLISVALFAIIVSLQVSTAWADNKSSKVLKAEDIQWGYLNPLRGALSPAAANLWGDRTTNAATGMLVRFNKGFQSPPHIHNITYRGVVIDGLMHNASPNDSKAWMPQGSFWTQPAGNDHITAAKSDSNLIYLEIDSGPYLVMPSKDAFASEETPLNLHRDNIAWLGSNELNYLDVQGAEAVLLWQNHSKIKGYMLKLPVGFKGQITTQGSEFKAVLISGRVGYSSIEQPFINLVAGSFIESNTKFQHNINNIGDQTVRIYIRTNNKYWVE